MQTVHCIVSGKVQGVGFRYWTQKTARAMNITGWVRNRPDGTVELMAQGTEEALKPFSVHISKGPALSKVTGTTCKPIDTKEIFEEFLIRY